ncbi:hypothetical protein JG688_00004419, partial [Phytophthora aleatoria]
MDTTKSLEALVAAAGDGDVDTVKNLIDTGSDVNSVDAHSLTPLLSASRHGHTQMVQFLVGKGAYINKSDQEGDTPLIIAAIEGHVEIVQFLLEIGDDEAKNGKLLDYLYHAREEGRSLVWRKLLDAALGLHFLHERHIVHTDLKCNQILVSKDGVAMLTDFGLSFLTTEQSEDDKTVGAIRWKAPEVIRKGNPVAPNALSDVYSFGMCVVEAVTGDVPWGQHVPDPVVKFHVTRKKFIPRPKAFNSDAEWELVEKMCAFEPSERIKLSDAIEKIRGFAEEERFQERLRQMQQEGSEDVEFA